jgi:hypothetical protein
MAGTILISNRSVTPSASTQSALGSSAAERDLWIFRDGKHTVSGPDQVRDLRRRIAACSLNGDGILDALIQAGELEAALADAGSDCLPSAARITDILAAVLCDGDQQRLSDCRRELGAISPPSCLSISPPEGFTYYALHPSDFVHVLARLPADPPHCAVVGVRSIGTTLSAVVLASLHGQNRPATRITVRPSGHPYSRRTEFSQEQLHWIDQNLAAQFLVVDEGPGRSGSTFLSVAEALLRAGVSRENITLLGSREPDVSSLCADDAASRWASFRFLSTTPSVNHRFERCAYAGGGEWRRLLFSANEPWPESWTQMERLKFISPDWQTLYKFEGMGSIGSNVRNRAFALAEAGFAPAASDAGDGFLAYALVQGTRMRVQNATSNLLDVIARYCAFRHANFGVGAEASASQHLREMVEFNVAQEFGMVLQLGAESFVTDHPVIADGSMQPYEWIATGSESFLKTDSVDHGDNHFFPGPCDIAWDLAGIAVEWQLAQDATDYLVRRFFNATEVDISSRLALYKLAYSVFRLGFCKMAISTVRGSEEENRLRKAYKHYRGIAHQLLEVASLNPKTT